MTIVLTGDSLCCCCCAPFALDETKGPAARNAVSSRRFDLPDCGSHTLAANLPRRTRDRAFPHERLALLRGSVRKRAAAPWGRPRWQRSGHDARGTRFLTGGSAGPGGGAGKGGGGAPAVAFFFEGGPRSEREVCGARFDARPAPRRRNRAAPAANGNGGSHEGDVGNANSKHMAMVRSWLALNPLLLFRHLAVQ
jgi:hypothetical protein